MNNTVIFMSDEHNPFYSSVYNHPFVKTPNMEKLKEIGTLYNNAYCPSPLCLPSRSSFLFGRRVHELQTYNNCHKNLKLKFETFSSILRSKGIHLVHIGKAHYGKNIKQLGFNEVHLANETASDIYIQRNPLAIRKEAKKRGNELLLSEILFNVEKKSNFQTKYEKILLDINETGFRNAALIHSESDTATNGGLIGWIKEDNLNSSIKEKISKIEIGQFSEPIRTSSGFIIIKIENKKEYEIEFNLEEKINEIVRFKTNEQLNSFSNIHFNKVKKDLILNDL